MTDHEKRPPLFERLKKGLEDAIRFERGEIDLRTTAVPDLPPRLGPEDIIRLRRGLQMSRAMFARLINVSTRTIQNWEQGVRSPTQAALRLLQVLGREPAIVCKAAGLPEEGTLNRPDEIQLPRRRDTKRSTASGA